MTRSLRQTVLTVIALVGSAQLVHAQSAVPSKEEFLSRLDRFNCTVAPLQIVEMSASVDGVVDRVAVVPGQKVNKGDIVAYMDDSLAKSDYELAKIRANSTAMLDGSIERRDGLISRVARLERGYARKAVSAADVEASRLELGAARAAVAAEQEQIALAEAELARTQTYLEQLVLKSPVTGIVGEELIKPGEHVSQHTVATLYVNQPLRVEAFVPAAQVPSLVDAQNVEIVINDNERAPYTVEFDYAAPVADLASNTISIYFNLNAPDVLPGSKCTLSKASS